MRWLLLIFLCILIGLFSLVYIESELVRINIRKEKLKNRLQELENEKAKLKAELIKLSNLAHIENEAKKRGFIYPAKEDIIEVIK